MLNDSACKPNKMWTDKGSEFYNRPMKSQYQDIDTEMYSTYNEGKFVVAGKLGRTLKEQTVDFNNNNKLVDIVNEQNNTYNRAVKAIQDGGSKAPLPFFPCNFCRHRKQPPKVLVLVSTLE